MAQKQLELRFGGGFAEDSSSEQEDNKSFWDDIINITSNVPGVLTEDEGSRISGQNVYAGEYKSESESHYSQLDTLHENGKIVQDIYDKVFANLTQDDQLTQIEPSPVITTKLYPHQKQALNWMIKKENGDTLPPFWQQKGKQYVNTITKLVHKEVKPVNGGILADDMGLGKTLVVISLIMTNPRNAKLQKRSKNASFNEDSSSMNAFLEGQANDDRTFSATEVDLFETISPSWMDANPSRSKESEPHATLIICPTSVINNWVDQIKQHVSPTSVSVLVHYGQNRKVDIHLIKQYDVVITSYRTVLSESKRNCLSNIEWLRIVLDEGHEIRNPKTQTAQVIYEMKAVRRWVLSGTPIQNSMLDLWSLIKFLQVEPLIDKHYWNTLIAYPLQRNDESAFQRVSHLMRNLALRRTKKHHVNGKPIVDLPARNVHLRKITLNKEQRMVYDRLELEGKIKIDEYIVNNTISEHLFEIFVLQLRLRQFCCHPQLVAKIVADKLSQYTAAQAASAPGTFYNPENWSEKNVLCPLCWNPPKNIVMAAHGRVYCWHCIQRTNPAAHPSQANTPSDVVNLTELLDKLNSACQRREECSICSGKLQDALITSGGHIYCRPCFLNNSDYTIEMEDINPDKKKELIGELFMWLELGENGNECPICLKPASEISDKDAVITLCRHCFCSECITKVLSQPQGCCPVCRSPLDKSKLVRFSKNMEEGVSQVLDRDEWKSSAKSEALMSALTELKNTDPDIKSIVVSQFTSLLDLIEVTLRYHGFEFRRLDGQMSRTQRAKAITDFSQTHSGSPTVFLLSLKAGGVGINLTSASRVFLMEPAWNPAAEEQCFDRCHRLGQKRDVEITKFIIEDSVEENMLKLQDKKRALMKGAFPKKLTKAQRRENQIKDILQFFQNRNNNQ